MDNEYVALAERILLEMVRSGQNQGGTSEHTVYKAFALAEAFREELRRQVSLSGDAHR
jgi:hypothetical protein